MTNKKKLNIFLYLYLIFFILFIIVILALGLIQCPFKLIFDIPCPICGMTRAFRELFKLNISKAIYYNILSIPLFIFIIYFTISFIKDLINKESTCINKIFLFLKKYWIIIIILLIISEIFNIIHDI